MAGKNMSDQERIIETEARRLSQLLDVSYEEALRALRNLLELGLIQRSQINVA